LEARVDGLEIEPPTDHSVTSKSQLLMTRAEPTAAAMGTRATEASAMIDLYMVKLVEESLVTIDADIDCVVSDIEIV
jgi:hypothetical protein